MQRSEEKEIKMTQHDCAQLRDEPSVFNTNGTQTLRLTSKHLTLPLHYWGYRYVVQS